MDISPKGIFQLFPPNAPPIPQRGSHHPSFDLHQSASGFSKPPHFNQNDISSNISDQNFTILLQKWLLNTLSGVPGIFTSVPDLKLQNSIPFLPFSSPFSEQERHNFILQDLHEKYKKLITSQQLRALNNSSKNFQSFPIPKFNSTVEFGRNSFPTMPSYTTPFLFPFFPPQPQKNERHSCFSPQLPNYFGAMPTEKDTEKVDPNPTSTIHHQGQYFKEENVSPERTQVDDSHKDKKTHKCMYCGKLYSRKYGLKIHIRTHTGYKPLKCKVCGRPFGDPSNLNKHVRLHAEGDTPYRCEFCGKVLVRRRDLERHIKSRHPNATSKIDTMPSSWRLTA